MSDKKIHEIIRQSEVSQLDFFQLKEMLCLKQRKSHLSGVGLHQILRGAPKGKSSQVFQSVREIVREISGADLVVEDPVQAAGGLGKRISSEVQGGEGGYF